MAGMATQIYLRARCGDARPSISADLARRQRILLPPTILDAGVDLLWTVQIAARHADPPTTMRYDRACQNLDRHPNYILAACMASGT
jgi:hypothetical protein